ncbi:hypothetical protein Scep_024562 [Stephania cephalantha]|uniref:PPM-type phosphatase domain-containing protein n=1 Tax=Stephania cephalantha TaxID=152367 RepID=A0AAP0F2A7_9MAGN
MGAPLLFHLVLHGGWPFPTLPPTLAGERLELPFPKGLVTRATDLELIGEFREFGYALWGIERSVKLGNLLDLKDPSISLYTRVKNSILITHLHILFTLGYRVSGASRVGFGSPRKSEEVEARIEVTECRSFDEQGQGQGGASDYLEIAEPVGVIATPDIHSFDLTERDSFIILGCDGLWGLVDPRMNLKQNKSPMHASPKTCVPWIFSVPSIWSKPNSSTTVLYLHLSSHDKGSRISTDQKMQHNTSWNVVLPREIGACYRGGQNQLLTFQHPRNLFSPDFRVQYWHLQNLAWTNLPEFIKVSPFWHFLECSIIVIARFFRFPRNPRSRDVFIKMSALRLRIIG